MTPPTTSLAGAAALAAAVLASPALAEARSVVLVHGAVVDGSTWRPVHDLLAAEGFDVQVAQLPLTSLDDDVAAARRAIELVEGPVVLVGSSYGGAVISVAGDDPDVAALVYVAALQPNAGETVAELNAAFPPVTDPAAFRATADGMILIDPAQFPAFVAADIPEADAAFLARSQTPTNPEVFATPLPVAAWRDKPSWGIVATEDRSVNPDEQRWMYERSGAVVIELATSHLPHLAQPEAVADVIRDAARAVE